MTQRNLIIRYISEFSSILPAKMAGMVYGGTMFGSETSKRCREMRFDLEKNPKGILVSNPDGKFERFSFKLKTEDIVARINAMQPFAPKEKETNKLL